MLYLRKNTEGKYPAKMSKTRDLEMPDMLVRLKRGKTTFEVMVEEGKVTQYRDGTVKNLSEVVLTDVVWVNAQKGKRASADQLKKAFQTDNVQDVIKQIIDVGYLLSACTSFFFQRFAFETYILTIFSPSLCRKESFRKEPGSASKRLMMLGVL